MLGDPAVERETDSDPLFNRFFIGHGQSPRMSHAHRADVRVGMCFFRVVQIGAKHFSFGLELGMNFQTDDCFVHNERSGFREIWSPPAEFNLTSGLFVFKMTKVIEMNYRCWRPEDRKSTRLNSSHMSI